MDQIGDAVGRDTHVRTGLALIATPLPPLGFDHETTHELGLP
jgi:hypothetical protein